MSGSAFGVRVMILVKTETFMGPMMASLTAAKTGAGVNAKVSLKLFFFWGGGATGCVSTKYGN